MDDSASALDMETEYAIQRPWSAGRFTCFVIAHRISAVRNADEIIYFDDGRVVERGTHDQLLRLRGRYYETYRVQYHDYVEALEKEVV